jgi:hypothetical protein
MKRCAHQGFALLAILIAVSGCSLRGQEPATPTAEIPSSPSPATQTAPPARDIIIYPEGYGEYQKYLDVIGGTPGMADTGVIEATVASILKSEVCPYQEENCRIEPYPNDWGLVRVDEILQYVPYGAQDMEPAREQPGQTPDSGAETTAGSTGVSPPSKGQRHETLQPGQEIQTHFLFTARPAKVSTGSLAGPGSPLPSQPPGGEPEQAAEHRVQPGEPVYEPIPRDGDYLVFVTEIEGMPDSTEIILPGLEIGSRFRARIRYDGTLYVQEYEVIP